MPLLCGFIFQIKLLSGELNEARHRLTDDGGLLVRALSEKVYKKPP